MTTVRCADCRRILRATPVRDPGTRLPYGPCCAARRGLGPTRRPRTAQPKRTTNPEQPSLLDQLATSDEGAMTMSETPNHLQVETTDHSFDHLPPIPSEYGGDVRAHESSAADGPHVWLRTS